MEQRQAGRTARVLGLSRRERLQVSDVVRDADGQTHVRYTRTYAGLPVVGGDFVVHESPAGSVNDTDFASNLDLSELSGLAAKVMPTAARSLARRMAGLRQVHRQTPPTLAVYAVGNTPRLVWESVVAGRSKAGPQRKVVYVDARDGDLVNRWSLTQRVQGRGRSLYSGRVRVQTVRPGARFRLRDNTRGGHTTYDAGDRTLRTGDNGSLFMDADNRWGNGKTSSRQSAAVDAHVGVARTWDYFKEAFNRRGIRGDGKGVVSRVHFGRPGSPAAGNAFWDPRCFCITLGRGDHFFRPLVSVDVVAHEVSHGITSHTAGLLYFGESGGLNEATSDIFGTLVEFSARRPQDPGDYLIGEKLVKVRPGYLRRMDRPNADGVSYNCWSRSMGRDDVHYSSGPANHFFYLLAEGSGRKRIGGRLHRSPTCDGSRVGGIGKAPAARIWYRALNVYMTSTTDYADARDATIKAARDIFGRRSARCRTVQDAWNAVSVNEQNHNCNGELPAPGGRNAVRNGDFEDGSRAWRSDPAGTVPLIVDRDYFFPHRGRWWAALGGYASVAQDILSQGIAVPDTDEVWLRFQLMVVSDEPWSVRGRDFLRVEVRTGKRWREIGAFSNRHASNSYTQRDLNLSAYAGQSVRLRFRSRENSNSRATLFLLDDVQVRGG